MVEDDWRGFRRAPDGALLFYGWAVFGHILPRFGLTDFPCFANGEPADRIGAEASGCAYVRRGLIVEWFGRGLCTAFGQVRLLTTSG